jgi:gliding motility-associated-like protein
MVTIILIAKVADSTNIGVLYPNYSIEIYNRYGNVVHKGNINTSDFDGKSNQNSFITNDVLPVGVYFYIIEFNNNAKKPIQGYLYLSR